MLGQPVKAAFHPLSDPIVFPLDALGKRIELALETLGERVKLALKPVGEGIYLTLKTAEPVLDRPEASVDLFVATLEPRQAPIDRFSGHVYPPRSMVPCWIPCTDRHSVST